jgi:hypothetical protein
MRQGVTAGVTARALWPWIIPHILIRSHFPRVLAAQVIPDHLLHEGRIVSECLHVHFTKSKFLPPIRVDIRIIALFVFSPTILDRYQCFMFGIPVVDTFM